MIRFAAALTISFGLSVATAHGQALLGGGQSGTGGAPQTAQGFVNMLQSGQQAGATPSGFTQGSYSALYGMNNGFGFYNPAFGGGFNGLGFPGLNGFNTYNASNFGNANLYGAAAPLAVGYGANALTPLLLGRTVGNSNYYGNPVLTNVPYGVTNLYQLMPNQNVGVGNGNANANGRQFSGPKTNPGQGVAGAARGDSEASAILNGAMPSRENPRSAKKGRSGGRRSLARRAP